MNIQADNITHIHDMPYQRLPQSVRQAYEARHCLACNAPLTRGQATASHVCGQPGCQHHYRHLYRLRQQHVSLLARKMPSMIPRCYVCQWPLTPDEAARTTLSALTGKTAVCSDPACIALEEARQERVKQENARIEKARQAWQDALLKQLASERDDTMSEGEAWPLLLLPGNSRQLVALQDKYRLAFQEHLTQVITEALEAVPSAADIHLPEEEMQQASPLAAEACRLCGGNCCMHGGDKAYVSMETIQRYRIAFPDAAAAEIEAVFLARLPSQVYVNSCVYHGENGCGLGEWRSATCRKHFCQPLLNPDKQNIQQAWGVSLTAGEPYWTDLPWPRKGDKVLGKEALVTRVGCAERLFAKRLNRRRQ